MNPDDNQQTAPSTQTPAQPTAPAAPATPATAAAPGGNKRNVLIAVIAAAILLAGGIAYGVYAIISNTPENLIKSAVDNLSREKALAANIQVINGTKESGVTFSGDVAFTADQANGKNGEVLVGLGSADKRVGLSALSLDGTMYLKLANAENMGPLLAALSSESSSLSSPAFAAALKNVNGQWFEITKDEVQAFAQSSGNDSVTASPTPADIKKAMEIYGQHSFIKVDKTFADELVDGSNSAHFSIKVDKNEVVAFLQALKNANLETIKVTDTDIADAKNGPDPSSDGSVELWIARDSRKFKQLRVVSTKKGEEATFTVTLKSQLPTFDKLEAPAGAKPISQFVTTLLGPTLGSGFDDSMLQ